MRTLNCGKRCNASTAAGALGTDLGMGGARLNKMLAAERYWLLLPRNGEDDDLECYLAAFGAECASKIMRCAGGGSI